MLREGTACGVCFACCGCSWVFAHTGKETESSESLGTTLNTAHLGVTILHQGACKLQTDRQTDTTKHVGTTQPSGRLWRTPRTLAQVSDVVSMTTMTLRPLACVSAVVLALTMTSPSSVHIWPSGMLMARGTWPRWYLEAG